MIKDIPELKVENIAIAVVQEKNELEETVWNSYLINLKEEQIEGVLVTSTGYGELNEEKVRTSTLRHFLDEVAPKSFVKILLWQLVKRTYSFLNLHRQCYRDKATRKLAENWRLPRLA